jgi:hypothetical protein
MGKVLRWDIAYRKTRDIFLSVMLRSATGSSAGA